MKTQSLLISLVAILACGYDTNTLHGDADASADGETPADQTDAGDMNLGRRRIPIPGTDAFTYIDIDAGLDTDQPFNGAGGSAGSTVIGGTGGSNTDGTPTGGSGGTAGSTSMTGGQGGTKPPCTGCDLPKAPPCAAQGMCDGRAVTEWGSNFYLLDSGMTARRSADEALQECRDLGFGLLTVESAEEDLFLQVMGFGWGSYWLGYRAPWIELPFGKWQPGQPNNNDNRGVPEDCVKLSGSQWRDYACDLRVTAHLHCKARK